MKHPGSLPSPIGFRRAYAVPDLSLNAASRLWARNARGYAKSWKMNILPNFFEPLFYLLAIGFGLGRYIETIDGAGYADYITPGLAATSAMFGCSFDVTFNVFVKLHFDRLYDAVTVTPLSPEDVVLGEVLWAITRSLLYAVPFVVVAAIFGLVHSPWVLLTPLGAAVIGFCFSAIGMTFTAFVPIIDMYSYYFTLFITPMFLFSGVFFPTDTLPTWAQPVAWLSPLFHAAAMFRELFGVYGTDLVAAGGHMLWLLAVGAILFPVGPNVFRHRLIA